MVESKISIIWKTSNRRAKICDSRVVVEPIWGTFCLVAFKVMWGHSLHLTMFRKYDFQKSLLLLQITAEIYQMSSEFLFSQWSSQNYVWDLELLGFENWNVNDFFTFTWDPMGVTISKCDSSFKSQPKVFKLFPNFPPNCPHKSDFGIFEILSFWF